MKTRKSISALGSSGALALVLALALQSTAAMARVADLYEAPRVLSTSATPLEGVQMRDRIVRGGQALGWAVTLEAPGVVELTYDKNGKHQVTVAVRYDTAGYEVTYVRSFNLNYAEVDGVRKIHPNYNRWVLNLIKSIGPV